MTNCSCDTFNANGASPACNVNQSGSGGALVVNNTGTSINNSHGIETYSNAQGTYAVYAQCNGNGCGVGAFCNTGNAIIASTASGTAVNATSSSSTTGTAVYGKGRYGVHAYSDTYQYNWYPSGIALLAEAENGYNIGVYSVNYDVNDNGGATPISLYSVYDSSNGYAGYFVGPTYISGYLTKAGGGFKIDHPQDPENKFLYHGFVESPEMSNLYKGTASLDADGKADVFLPSYFESVNSDFVYQLTPIGAAMPNLHISQTITGNQFSVDGGVAGKQVSWTVTATRSDKWAKANSPGVEVSKSDEEKGFYMHPGLFGQGHDKAIHSKYDLKK